MIGRRARPVRKGKDSVPDPNVPAPVQSVSVRIRNPAHSDRAHLDQLHRDPAKAVQLGRRTTVPPGLQLGLVNAHRDPSSVQHSLDQHRRVQGDQPVNSLGAVPVALAPSRRSPGRNPIPIAPPSNLTPAHAEIPSLIVKKSKRPDHPACRLKQWSLNANPRSAPLQAGLRLAAPQRAVHHFVEPVLTGQPLVVLAKAVQASSGREQTGQAQIVQAQIVQLGSAKI